MATGQTIIPILSGDIKSFAFFHNYVSTSNQDRVLVQLEDSKLIMLKIDSSLYKITRTRPVLYMTKLISELSKVGMNFRECNLFPETSCGVDFGTYHSVFITLQDSFSKTRIMVQINTDDEFQTVDVIPITSIFTETRKFINISVNKNIAFTDLKQTQDMDVYIIYIDYIPKKEPEIKGIKIAVSQDEKDELRNFCSAELLDTKYPVVDVWTNEHILFTKLPQDVTDVKINFSTGLTFLKFGSD